MPSNVLSDCERESLRRILQPSTTITEDDVFRVAEALIRVVDDLHSERNDPNTDSFNKQVGDL